MRVGSDILLIGRNSYLGGHIMAAASRDHQMRAIGHAELPAEDLAGVGTVVVCSQHPDYMTTPYHRAMDIEASVAERLRGTGIHMVMLSSRKVYAPGLASPIPATAPATGTGIYGRNKVITERTVAELLGEHCTILRLANIFGAEPAGRRTFMGQALGTLQRDDCIILDCSPFTPRDFLPAERFGSIVLEVARKRPPGIFNLGAGHPTAVGQVVLWLLEGYGGGKMIVTDPAEKDPYFLDSRRFEDLIGPICHEDDIRGASLKIGRWLRQCAKS